MEKGSLADAKLNGRILVLFTAGFLAGLALIYIGQESLVVNADFLDSFSVGRMGVLDIDSSMLFFYSIKQRLAPAVLLAVLAVAGIGGMAVSLYLVWTGFCAGTILSVLSIRYGIRGILLFSGGIFPQVLLLAPAYLFLFRWCQGFQDRVYNGRYGSGAGGKRGALRLGTCNPGNAAGRLSGGELYQSDDITKSIFLFLKTGTISGTNIISITDILCFKQIVVKIPVKSAKMRIAFLRKTDYNVF